MSKPLFKVPPPRPPPIEFDGKPYNSVHEAKIAALQSLEFDNAPVGTGWGEAVLANQVEVLAILQWQPDGTPAKPEKRGPKRTLNKEQYQEAREALPQGTIVRADYALARRRVETLGWSVADAVSNPPRERKAKPTEGHTTEGPGESPGIRVEASSKHAGK